MQNSTEAGSANYCDLQFLQRKMKKISCPEWRPSLVPVEGPQRWLMLLYYRLDDPSSPCVLDIWHTNANSSVPCMDHMESPVQLSRHREKSENSKPNQQNELEIF